MSQDKKGGSLRAVLSSFFAPQDTSVRQLIRCQNCQKIMWRDGTEIRAHAGHRLALATEGTVWDFLRLKCNLIR